MIKYIGSLIGLLGTALLLNGCGGSSPSRSASLPVPIEPVQSNDALKVIVIGAGAAGLTAGFEIQKAGHEVIVLEARDRIGGRVWSDRRDGQQSVDLGAAWIHGINGNPAHELAQQQGLQLSVTDYDNMTVRSDPNGSALSTTELMDLYTLLNSKLMQGSLAPTETAISEKINEVKSENPDIDPRKLDYVAMSFIEQSFAGAVEELSIHALEEGEEDFSGNDVMFFGGYDQIFNDMVAALDIRLEQIVSSVNYSGNEVSITTADNTIYSADKVIVTVPLGVLKKGVISFDPDLPTAKQQAISDLGMGVFNKVYLGFPGVFWEDDSDFIAYYSEQQLLWPSILNLYKQYSDPALLAISTASEAITVETKTDEQIVAEIMAILKTQYGDDIPEPNDIRITRWAQDPFAFGSYSFMKTGASTQSRLDLAASVNDKLYFAGEATNPDYPATVHGAILSGLREAEKIR